MAKTMGTIFAVGFLLAGCSSMPDVTLRYYQVKSDSMATVTRTIGCDKPNNRVVIADAPSVSTTYSSDTRKVTTLRIKDLDGFFADGEIAATFTEDGRLKTINQSSTGQGEAAVKAAMSLVATVAAMEKSSENKSQCDEVERRGAGKPITLTYRARIDPFGTNNKLKPTRESAFMHKALQLDVPAITIGSPAPNDSYPNYTKSSGDVLLDLQRTSFVEVTFPDGTPTPTFRIIVPRADTYELPIPRAALFGRQGFSLALAESGAVTSVGYTKTTGVAAALNAAQSIAATETTSARAAELKAEADLIAQQQRVVLCRTKPEQCK